MNCLNCGNPVSPVNGIYYRCSICRAKYSKYTGEWKKKPFGWEPANGYCESDADKVVDWIIYVFLAFVFFILFVDFISKN